MKFEFEIETKIEIGEGKEKKISLSDIKDKAKKIAEKATCMAHMEGGVPIIEINIKDLTPYAVGQLIFFFEKACAISGYLLGVNPFDQPGVEEYKNRMREMLNRD